MPKLLLLNSRKKYPDDIINFAISMRKTNTPYDEIVTELKQKHNVEIKPDVLRKLVSRVKKKTEKTQNLPQVPEEMQKDLSDIIDEDLKEFEEQRENISTKKKYKELLIQLWNKQEQLENVLNVKNHKPKYKEIKSEHEDSEATAVWLASDWHTEEIVDPDTISQLNEYNPKIAEQRSINFFRNWLKLTNIFAQDINIDHIVMWILWDMISGYIHPELEESNAMSPTQALIKLKRILVQWINYLLENSNYKLTFVCKFWNHGRTTDKKRVSTSYKNSYEWMIYHLIADDFIGNPRVNFIIENWYHTYFRIYDYTCRFHHWDAIWYGWGIWGITIPVNKKIWAWNKAKPDNRYDFFWHFHQRMSHKNFESNWSLIGYNAFANQIWADFEEPQQWFCLIDKKRGKTISAPIFVTE